MTTHEMILLCPSLQGVRRCIPFVFDVPFCHLCSLWKIGLTPTNGLKHAAACRGTANLSGGPLVPSGHLQNRGFLVFGPTTALPESLDVAGTHTRAYTRTSKVYQVGWGGKGCVCWRAGR